jgi:hypothetical protein
LIACPPSPEYPYTPLPAIVPISPVLGKCSCADAIFADVKTVKTAIAVSIFLQAT